jgi:peptidoglycan lytic transglycosylase G
LSIRSGGRPRGERPPPRYEPDAYATESVPQYSEPYPRNRNGRGGRSGGGGVPGFIKFLLFALILGGFVVVVGLTALRPLVNNAVVGWAADNPGALSIPFVADIVREDLGDDLTAAASDDETQISFQVAPGDTATTIAQRLENEGFLRDSRAFVYQATSRELTGQLQSGEFILRKSQTPDELVTALLDPPRIPYVDINLRSGLRLEQITGLLEKLREEQGLQMDPQEFYELAKDPPSTLLEDYPWLRTALAGAPDGVNPSLEGFLWPSGYRVLPDTSAEELIRLMLDKFIEQVGEDRLAVAKDRGLTFYQVLTLASIVEREAVLPEERPVIAGVYQNRINGIKGVKNRLLNADPTVIYGADSVALAHLPIEDWDMYRFWTVPETPMNEVALPEELQGFQTYQVPGLVPWPIATPTVGSIDAALAPDTKDKYIYFVAIPDSGGKHAFAKTDKEHRKNLEKYGYR